ncbi:MAG: 5-oxoprolinase subunit PxpB [Gordonibacter sp.]|uniref:5-oxoprolinase subunit PxpB n=1 Tax=Gordonibacter sp. TaxID=1968902 RepID=UPI002FC9E757
MAGFTISIAGDSALNLEFAHTISAETSAKIRMSAESLTVDPIEGITELVPTFCSLMVYYNPLTVTFDELSARLRGKLRDVGEVDLSVRKIVQIPVCYGKEFGPDLDSVATHAGLSTREVVQIHTAHDYLIDMLGFLPGFAYLGGLDPRLHTPRLATPRTLIEPGSVGIGGAQTGIYPLASPGGWQIIGRTPLRPYDPDRTEPILYAAGEYLRFVPISPDEYAAIETQLAANTYEYRIFVEDN